MTERRGEEIRDKERMIETRRGQLGQEDGEKMSETKGGHQGEDRRNVEERTTGKGQDDGTPTTRRGRTFLDN